MRSCVWRRVCWYSQDSFTRKISAASSGVSKYALLWIWSIRLRSLIRNHPHLLLEQLHRLAAVIEDPRRAETSVHIRTVGFCQKDGDFVIADRAVHNPDPSEGGSKGDLFRWLRDVGFRRIWRIWPK